MPNIGNDWNEHKLYIMNEINDLKKSLDKLTDKINAIKESLAVLQTKILAITTGIGIIVGGLVSLAVNLLSGN